MRKLILLGFIFFNIYAISAYSQVNFQPGFILTNNLDTVFGNIDYRSDTRMCKICSFKTKETGKKTYLPGEIFAFGFKDGRYFETNLVNGKLNFFEVLIKGEASIYYYADKNNDLYFLKINSGELKQLEYFEETVYFDGSGRANDGKFYSFANDSVKGEYLIRSQEFKQILLDSLKDEPELHDDIQSMKKPNHKDLINLTKEYHVLKGKTQEEVVYNNLHIKSDYAFSIGWFNVYFREFRKNETIKIYSLKGYAPLAYRKFYIGYGFQYAPYKLNYTSYKIYRVPVSVRYQYTGKFIKPHASLGLNVYCFNNGNENVFVQDFVVSYSAGIAVKVYKDIHITFDMEGDFLWNSYYNSNTNPTFSQMKSIGVMVSF